MFNCTPLNWWNFHSQLQYLLFHLLQLWKLPHKPFNGCFDFFYVTLVLQFSILEQLSPKWGMFCKHYNYLWNTWLKGKDGGRSAQTCLGKYNCCSSMEMANTICVVRQVFYLGFFYFTTCASTTSGRSETGMAQWYGVHLTRGVSSVWSGLALLRHKLPYFSFPVPNCAWSGPNQLINQMVRTKLKFWKLYF
jgi:hypothetical protein